MSKFIKFLNEEVNTSSIIYAITLKLYNETANMQTDAQKLNASVPEVRPFMGCIAEETTDLH